MPRLVNDPNGASSDDLEVKVGNFSLPMKTSAAVSAKRAVAIASAGTVATVATDGNAKSVVGIAANAAAASGDTVNVILFGVAEDVPITTDVTQWDLLKRSTTTAGSLASTATPAAGEVVAVALRTATSTAGSTDVWVTAGTAKALS